MQTILDFLSGKKTYITAILFALFNLGIALNLWTTTNAAWTAVNAILAALGFGFLRNAITVESNPVVTTKTVVTTITPPVDAPKV